MAQKDISAWVLLASAHAHLDDMPRAEQALAQARALRPQLSALELAANLPYARQEALDHLIEGVRKAGLVQYAPPADNDD